MFQNKHIKELQDLYILLKRCPDTLTILSGYMKLYIQSREEEIIKDPNSLENPSDCKQKVLDLKQELDEIITQAFENNIIMKECCEKAFFTYMNA